MGLNKDAKKFACDLLERVDDVMHDLCMITSRSERTEIVKKLLRKMAHNQHFELNPKVRGHREFLCDFSWVRYVKQHKMWLCELGMVAECEWAANPRSIVYDFRKLIPLKAPLKLCVYQVRGENPDGAAEKCRKQVAKALQYFSDHRSEEVYFLLEIRRKDRERRLYYWSADFSDAGRGRLRDRSSLVRFRAWPG